MRPIRRQADGCELRRSGPEAAAIIVWTLNFGPQHPATHTTLRLVLLLDGERVLDAVPDIGYLHSGFEKIGEHLDYNQYVTVTDRMNYISPLANNVAWHGAVERLLGIELTPRCKYIRTIVAELARISDHLLCNGAVGLDTGAFTYFLYAFYQREVLYDIFETLCGARFTNSYTRTGGVMYDMTPLVVEKIRTFVRTFPKTLDDMDRLLNRNRIFVDRTTRRRHPDPRGGHQPQCHRADRPGQRRDARPAQGRALSGLRRFRFQDLLCPGRRLLRPLSGADGRDAREPEDRRPGDRESAGRPGQRRHRRADRAADQAAGLPDDRGDDLAFRAGDEQSRLRSAARRSRMSPSSRPTANWAFIWSATAPTSPIGPVAGRRRTSTLRCFPHLIRGHTLSDVVAVLGSLNIIAAELDR